MNNIEKLQSKVTETVLIASGILILLIIFDDLSLKFYLIAFIKLPVIIIFIFAYIKLKRSGFKEKYTHFVNLPMLAFFIVNYLGNQGTQGPTFYGVLTLFVVYPILLSRKWSWFYTVLTLVVMSALLYMGSNKYNLLVPDYLDAMDQFQDHLFTFVSVSIFLVLLVTLVLDFYKKQNIELIDVHKKLKEQLTVAYAERQKNEALLRILAHDVRSPINNLGDLIYLSDENSLTLEEYKKFIDGLKYRVNDLKITIDSILTNIKRNPQLDVSDEVNDSPLIFTKKIVEELNNKFLSKSQSVFINCDDKFTTKIKFISYISEITIVLKNLLDNASKFSPEGSAIFIHILESENDLIWKVEDHAEKVSPKLQNLLFQQAVNSQTGSGVGLFLCKSIVDSIGATLNYVPLLHGNCFELRIR